MHLKKENFGEGDQVLLHELSALQRMEYLEFIADHSSKLDAIPADAPESKKMAEFGSLTMKLHAWLVSRSLWHSDRKRNIDEIMDEVLNDWSPKMITSAAVKVQELSDILPVESDSSADDTTPKSLGKS
ncbi:hypothetical protein F157LOC_00791 [Pectobacterium brasiliense]|uniref:phage tail assembly chaperone G n=1 Tax=Pectobacterium brasiliense TaxID=180957 RepID=UPI000CE68A0C|nr:phage minor tail protein G [Pectobacterium brasiliense]PPE61957.1 hypothetical protein F157LOC_00791 [Pectobacterium brasiliense]